MVLVRANLLWLAFCLLLGACYKYNPDSLHSRGGGLWSDSEGRSGSFESEIEISVPDSSDGKAHLRYDLSHANGEERVVEFLYDNSAIANNKSKADIFSIRGNKMGSLRIGKSIVAKLHDNDQTIELEIGLNTLRETGELPVTGKIARSDGHSFTWSDSLSIVE